jgi:hypothetical protein
MATIEKALCDYVTLNKVPILPGYGEAREFLEEDLRIDPSHWTRFNLIELRRLNRIYRNKNIEQILEVLDQEGHS